MTTHDWSELPVPEDTPQNEPSMTFMYPRKPKKYLFDEYTFEELIERDPRLRKAFSQASNRRRAAHLIYDFIQGEADAEFEDTGANFNGWRYICWLQKRLTFATNFCHSDGNIGDVYGLNVAMMERMTSMALPAEMNNYGEMVFTEDSYRYAGETYLQEEVERCAWLDVVDK